MQCECGGMLLVILVEEPPENLPKHKRLFYGRLCDVECQKCGKIVYSQPYDFGKSVNPVEVS